MQALIPLIAGLSLVSGAQFNLLPYAYLSSPLPVYNQYQNTRTGEHAYSYAGGPSAKEEIKGADGVVRGSYSYVDANGILQSVFYVADNYGFRVAATDLPSDDNLSLEPEATHVLLARSVKPDEQQKTEEQEKPSRRKRSLDLANENQSEQTENAAGVKLLLSEPAVGVPLSTSHQSQVQINKDIKIQPGLVPQAQLRLEPLILQSEIPLATSQQSQVQVQNSASVKLSGAEDAGKDKPIDFLRLPVILQAPTRFDSLPVLTTLPSYHENRIELHKQLGIEGAKLKDAVKISQEPIALVQSPSVSVPVLTKQAVPVLPIAGETLLPATSTVTTSISSHGVSQIHPSTKIYQPLAVPTVPLLEQKTVPVVPLLKEAVPATKLATATVTASVSSHGVTQIHGDSKVNVAPTLLLKTAPLAQLHPAVDLPVYLY
ncbi:uncharacterized protein LOC117219612 [Megalopta genalis]|uniref:uncharacterized protein LOC117219612 n=1 Tax=Megalopta genalis TaxID=115081 RepID=UPI003FD483AB